MNENIDLTKILKDCPKGTKLYSTIFGDVIFERIDDDNNNPYSIIGHFNGAKGDHMDEVRFTKEGLFLNITNTECALFYSKDQRDWSKVNVPWYKKDKFNPKTLNPFDRILVKRYDDVWMANFLSYYTVINPKKPNLTYIEFTTITSGTYRCCIPYNDDTKYLAGTTEEAPEYYRYWED